MNISERNSLLIIAATELEIKPLLDHLAPYAISNQFNSFLYNGYRIDVQITGIGIMATTFHLSQILQNKQYQFAIQLGISGAFPHPSVQLSEVVWVLTDQLVDLGVLDTQKQFKTLAEIGLQEPSTQVWETDPSKIIFTELKKLKTSAGRTVNCPTGDPSSYAPTLSKEGNSSIITESMEGAAFHYVCCQYDLPFIQLRGISNWVAPRDLSQWKIAQAVSSVNQMVWSLLSQETT